MYKELEKAMLATTSSSGQSLIPETLEPMLIEYLGRNMPMYMLIDKQRSDGKTHEYNKRTAVPQAWVEGEATPQNPMSSTYVRENVQLKILRTWGSVTGFQQKVSERFINALESEIVGSMEGLADLFEMMILWGNDADQYQFNGLDTYIAEDAVAGRSIASGGSILDINAVLTLSHLDSMIDAAEQHRGTQDDTKVFIASQQMISLISGLQTKIQRQVQTVEFEGGFRMETYRGIPLVPSSFVRPAGTTTSPTPSGTATAGGTLANDEYFYAISSVTMYGEQLVGVEESTTTASTNNSVTLTWTADANARLYKIWRGTATGELYLLCVIAAKTYAADGSVSGNVTSFIDNGSYTVNTAIRPLEAGEECIFLANLDPQRGAALIGALSPLGDAVDNFVTFTQLAITRSTFDYMIESFTALKVPYPQLHAVARRVRITA